MIDTKEWELVELTYQMPDGSEASKPRCLVKCPECGDVVNKLYTQSSFVRNKCWSCRNKAKLKYKVGEIVANYKILKVGVKKKESNKTMTFSKVKCLKCKHDMYVLNSHLVTRECLVCKILEKQDDKYYYSLD